MNRGTVDVCIVVCDGLKGLPDAIADVWPQAIVQTCVLHLIRNSFRYASKADWAELAKRPAARLHRPDRAGGQATGSTSSPSKWGERYPAIVRLWQNAWAEFVPFLAYAPRSARSSTRPTRSRACTPASAAPSGPAATSPTNRPP